MNKPWTTTEQKRLGELYQRFDMNGCSMILDRPVNGVKDMVSRLSLKSPRNTGGNIRQFYAQDIANIFELVSMGFCFNEIAKCFQSNLRTIQTVVRRAESHGFDAYPMRGM